MSFDNAVAGAPQLGGQISSGEVAQPANVGAIMQGMLSQVVTPDQIGTTPAVQPVQNKVTIEEPRRVEPRKAEPEADVSLFTEEPKEEVQAEAVSDEPDMSDLPDNPAAENFKKLRESIKNERKALKEVQREFETTRSKLEKYEKGEIVPEIISAKDLRIQELEKYEIAVNGKLSEEYQTLVVKPSAEKSLALSKLAEDYQVPENIREQLVQRIVETENAKERNQLITRYFPDAIGATKVEGLVRELHQLGQTALDMEKKPAEVMQSLQAQYQEKKQKEDAIRANQFESVSKVAWTKALEKTAGEGLFPELIMDPNNAEISKIAEKNQHRAAIQFGALMKKLHENGMKNAPEDLVTGLARAVQLSIGSVSVAKRLAAAEAELAELKGTNGMIATYFRPGVNSNGNARPAASTNNDKGPMSPKDAGAMAASVFKKY